MRMPSTAGYVIVFVAGMLVGIAFTHRGMGESYEARVEARPADASGKSAKPAPQSRLELSGSASTDSDEFDLSEGTARISVEHDGPSWLWVELTDGSRSVGSIIGALGFLGSNLGPSKTRTMVHIPKGGRYHLQVKAQGNWKVGVAQ